MHEPGVQVFLMYSSLRGRKPPALAGLRGRTAPGLVLPGKESLPQAEASKGECHKGMKVCKTYPANRKQMGLLSIKHIEEKNANGTKICRRLLEVEENNLLSCKVDAKRINMHKGLRFRF